MLVVIDTNVLLVSISDRSQYHWLYKLIIERRIDIAFTHDMLLEYEEQIAIHWKPEVASDVVRSLIELSTVSLVVRQFKLNLINTDEDDNKFVDCAFAANADYIVTNDNGFSILKKISFPKIKVVSIDAFKNILIERKILE